MKKYVTDDENALLSVAEPVAAYAVNAEQHQTAEVVDMTLLWQMLDKLSAQQRTDVGNRLVFGSVAPSRTLSDEQLELKLADYPSWDDCNHAETDSLTREDYQFAVRHSRHKAMKGIEKWL